MDTPIHENEWNVGSLDASLKPRPLFDHSILAPEHLQIAITILGSQARLNNYDAAIASPDGDVYLYRWHVIRRNNFGGTYFHVQVADDPDTRGYHDHPYDTMSIHLAHGHVEVTYNPALKPDEAEFARDFLPGESHFRPAERLHTLRLRRGQPYAMTLFSHGTRRREWGFQKPGEPWRPASYEAEIINGVAVSLAGRLGQPPV